MLSILNFSISSATKSVWFQATVVKTTSDIIFPVLQFALQAVVHCLSAIQRIPSQKEKLIGTPLHFN